MSSYSGAVEAINLIERTYRELNAQGRRVLKLFSGNPNDQGFHFPSSILEKVYLPYFKTQEYHPHSKGLQVAREAIAAYYEGQGARVDPEHLILTSGTSESFFYLFSLLTEPGDNVLVPNPAYPLFDYIAQMARIELRHYSLREEKDWRVDVEEMKAKADERTKAILLVSPNNPTGAVHSAEQLREIVEWANEQEIPLICDEVFAEFYFGAGHFPRPIAISAPRLCFTLNGISKMFALPGLKLSWIAVTGETSLVEKAVDRLETVADTFLSCHIPIQQALPLLFSEGKEFLKSYHHEVGHRRVLAVHELQRFPEIRFVSPEGGFYLTGEIAKPLPCSEEEFVIRLMREKEVFVHPGYFFDYEKGIHFVISFLTEPEALRSGIERLGEFVKGLHHV
ncbi:MAG: pyridoxal phosphate-dependent aminotransferase [bacterium]